MSTYVIVLVEEVTDLSEIAEYRRIGLPTLQEHKPDFLLRMAKAETFEGPEVKGGVVMLRFPSREAADAWWNSPGYQEALPHRLRGSRCHTIIVSDQDG